MANQAFGSNQDVTPAAAPQAHVGFIAPVRDPLQGVESNLTGLQTSLTKLAKEQNFREMGDFVSKARSDIRNIDNPVMRRIRAEEYKQNFLKRFGTEHKDTISLLDAPDIKQKIDFANNEIVSTDQATGERSVQTIDNVGDPQSTLTNHMLNTFAEAGEGSPRAAKYLEQIMGGNAGKPVDMSTFYNTASHIADFQGGLDRTMARYGALRQFANHNNIEVTDKDKADVARSIQNNMFAMFSTFMDGSYRRLITNPNNDISPNELTNLFDMVARDAVDSLLKSGAADRLGMDLNEISTKISTVRKHLVDSFDEAAKGDNFKAQLAATKAKTIMEFNNSTFMNNLKQDNPDAWKMLQVAPTLNALSNASYLTTVFEAAKRKGASPSEQAIANTQIDLFGSLLHWKPAKVAASRLELLHVRNADDAAQGLQNIQQVIDNQGAIVFHQQISNWFTENMNAITELHKNKFLSDEQYNHIVSQKEKFEQRVKLAIKSSGKTPEEVDKDNAEVSTVLDKLLRVPGAIARGTVNAVKTILPDRKTTPVENE